MCLKLHPYQEHCVNKILENNNIGLFLDMGRFRQDPYNTDKYR